jgi:ribosomal-protein-alanine N-acetyltransferase
VQVREANPGDVPAMVNLERQSPSAGHWSQEQYEKLFRATDGPCLSERVAWVMEEDEHDRRGGNSRQAEILAFLVAQRIEYEWELENVVVRAETRRRGVASLLLRELVAHACARHGSSIFLEVRQSNQAARALYRKFGFEEAGLRRGYYANPLEDAILYRRNNDLEFSHNETAP